MGKPAWLVKDKMKKPQLTEERTTFKPFKYPWAYDAWLQHEQSHWLHTEVPMGEDLKDYQKKLTKEEKEFLTKILRFFVQGDLDIGDGYYNHYIPVFKQPEVRMMMSGFAGREALHVAAYAHLIETLGLPESTYNEFLKYGEMVEKHEYFQTLDEAPIAEKIATISAFGEGMQLFSSFVMLLNFARHGKLKGLGQIIAWSIVDETQHAEGMIKVYREWVKQHPEESTSDRIKEIAKEMVELEDKFIDLAFGMYEVQGLTAQEVKEYIRYIADRRLIAMGMKGVFKVKKNPLPWVDGMLGVSHTNFFEQRVTDYSKGATKGTWDDVWGKA
jgi:ribonucleoside-diphosphate reductase beta chain